MPLVNNERVKLTATWFNSVAAATVVTGAIAPVVAIVFGLPTSGAISAAAFALTAAVWLLLGIGLHIWARHILRRRLQE